MLASSTVLTWCRVDVMAESYTMSSWSGGGGGGMQRLTGSDGPSRSKRYPFLDMVRLLPLGGGGGCPFFNFFLRYSTTEIL